MTKKILFLVSLIFLMACRSASPTPFDSGTQTVIAQPRAAQSTATPTRQPITTETPQPPPTETRIPRATLTAEAIMSHEGSLRVMSWNILHGGDHRLPQILIAVKLYNPDILGIQEANRWYLDEYAIAEQVANELGMNYIYCKGQSDYVDPEGDTFDTVIMTKFEILDSESYSEIEHCTGRAKILLPDSQTIQFFNTHLPPIFTNEGAVANECPEEPMRKFANATRPYTASGLAIALGDFNTGIAGNWRFRTPSPAWPEQEPCLELLLGAGW